MSTFKMMVADQRTIETKQEAAHVILNVGTPDGRNVVARMNKAQSKALVAAINQQASEIKD